MTAITPTLQILSKNRDIDATLNIGGSGNVFLNNSDLNFISAQVGGSVVLDGWVGQFIPGLKLRIGDSFAFTPEAPNFVTSGTPVDAENVFARGIQTVRANTITNSISVAVSYPISESFSIRGDYLYSLLRVGDILFGQATPVPAIFFNTDFQRWSIGPSYRVSPSDLVSLNFQTITSEFREKDTGLSQPISQSITARALEAEYRTDLKPWVFMASAGATMLEQGSEVFFSGKLAVSRELDRSTRVSLDASRQLAPAFFATGGALLSTTVGVTINRELGRTWSIAASGNYALNKAIPVELIQFKSYAVAAILSYTGWRDITPTLSYQYTHFEVSDPTSGYTVNRSAVLLGVTASWK